MKMKIWLTICVLAQLFISASALAQSETIDVEDGDEPLTIIGWIEEADDFNGNLRLVANGSDIEEFVVLASDLKQEDGDTVIGRKNVDLEGGDLRLEAGVPKDYIVTVSDVKEPGTYKGQIKLMPTDKNESESAVIELVVIAKSRSKLAPLEGSDKMKLHLVNSNGSLAKFILPAGAFINEWELELDNPTRANVSVISSHISLIGEKTAYQLTDRYISLPQNIHSIPPDRIGTMTLRLNRTDIPADSYSGNIYLLMDNNEDRLTIPVNIDVRNGPRWAAVALLLGIILGRLFKYMQDKQPQLKAIEAVNRVANLVYESHPDDQKILKPMIDDFRKNVYREKLEDYESELKAIESRLQMLKDVREIESKLKGKEGHPKAAECLKKVAQVRDAVELKNDEDAKKKVDELEAGLEELSSTLMGRGERDTDLEKAKTLAHTASKAAGYAATAASPRAAPTRSERIISGLVSLTGLSDLVQAEMTYWFVRPLLYAALLLGLLTVGLQSLYIENGLTFGVDPFSDYLALVLWGLSADVAGRSLSSLQGSGERSPP